MEIYLQHRTPSRRGYADKISNFKKYTNLPPFRANFQTGCLDQHSGCCSKLGHLLISSSVCPYVRISVASATVLFVLYTLLQVARSMYIARVCVEATPPYFVSRSQVDPLRHELTRYNPPSCAYMQTQTCKYLPGAQHAPAMSCDLCFCVVVPHHAITFSGCNDQHLSLTYPISRVCQLFATVRTCTYGDIKSCWIDKMYSQ